MRGSGATQPGSQNPCGVGGSGRGRRRSRDQYARSLSTAVQDPVRLGHPEGARAGFGESTDLFASGQTLGGSSAMNAMIYIRGNAADFDSWADEGAPGWSYREMLPSFIRSECNERGDPRYHGHSGPLAVQDSRSMNPLVDHLLEAGATNGYLY